MTLALLDPNFKITNPAIDYNMLTHIILKYMGDHSNIFLSAWSLEYEHKLMFGSEKKFSSLDALKIITREEGLEIDLQYPPKKLVINIILHHGKVS